MEDGHRRYQEASRRRFGRVGIGRDAVEVVIIEGVDGEAVGIEMLGDSSEAGKVCGARAS